MTSQREKANPFHFIRLNNETKLDLEIWMVFILTTTAKISKRISLKRSEMIHLYTDAFGVVSGTSWVQGVWLRSWTQFLKYTRYME